MSRLKRAADSALGQRLLRSGPARRLTTQLVAAQKAPEDVVTPYAFWAEFERRGPAPTAPPDGPPPSGPLDVALVIPGFRRGSGGHMTIANIIRGLERRGHRCSIWIDDPSGLSGGGERFREFFGPFAAPVHDDLSGWRGAQIALATGWQTVAPVLMLPGCAARAQLLQDDEPQFYATSAERLWAERSALLPAITAGGWLEELARARDRHLATFELAIDHAVYRPHPGVTRNPRRVLFYARAATPRRGVPLGLLALAELHRRRPGVEIALYGDAAPLATPFPHVHLGILDPAEVARGYAGAGAGLVLSLTNYSLAAQEMLACGCPAVELRTPSTEAAFGGSPIALAGPTIDSLADALEHALDHGAERAAEGLEWASTRTWDAAAAAVEQGLRRALVDSSAE